MRPIAAGDYMVVLRNGARLRSMVISQ